MEPAYIPLSQAVGELRTEIIAAVKNAKGEDLRFALEQIEVEFQVVATTTGKAEARASIWQVVTLKGSIEHANAATHKVKLVLKPRQEGSPDETLIGDEVSERPQ
ncbi:hypothetical protein KZ829_01395 [Actinoplanes hulinensis]|uniref:Trypsin-co-occurring domain-containing protein n=1 Tax=Actinoplanes hulinensis TaxID=1144547 RepID=A0ABS7AWD6_9ACTN|nr:trypco2 family protein [Actinoplanes hulinensis]MBW6432398.1 hypothetical protein [Actinoplanes hulinensis]